MTITITLTATATVIALFVVRAMERVVLRRIDRAHERQALEKCRPQDVAAVVAALRNPDMSRSASVSPSRRAALPQECQSPVRGWADDREDD